MVYLTYFYFGTLYIGQQYSFFESQSFYTTALETFCTRKFFVEGSSPGHYGMLNSLTGLYPLDVSRILLPIPLPPLPTTAYCDKLICLETLLNDPGGGKITPGWELLYCTDLCGNRLLSLFFYHVTMHS